MAARISRTPPTAASKPITTRSETTGSGCDWSMVAKTTIRAQSPGNSIMTPKITMNGVRQPLRCAGGDGIGDGSGVLSGVLASLMIVWPSAGLQRQYLGPRSRPADRGPDQQPPARPNREPKQDEHRDQGISMRRAHIADAENDGAKARQQQDDPGKDQEPR